MRAPSLDPEAVADPIRGSLELSRIVAGRLPLLLGTILLAAVFIGGWLVLLAGGVLSYCSDLLDTGDMMALGRLFLLSMPLWLGVMALGLLARGALFLRAFGAGHLAVERAGEEEPEEYTWGRGPGSRGRGPGGECAVPGGAAANPASAVLSLARGPSARAGETAHILRLLALLIVPLVLLLAADAVLLVGGRTLLWRPVPAGAVAVDAILMALGLAALLAIAFSEPLLRWVFVRIATLREVERMPAANIPAGGTLLERYMKHIHDDERYRPLLYEMLKSGKVGAVLRGASGREHRFDLYLQLAAGTAFGRPRALFLRLCTGPPGIAELEDMERAVSDVVSATGIPPARAVLLYSGKGVGGAPEPVPDEVYERLMDRHITGRAGWRSYSCAVELVTEQPDGTYDFVPFKVPGG